MTSFISGIVFETLALKFGDEFYRYTHKKEAGANTLSHNGRRKVETGQSYERVEYGAGGWSNNGNAQTDFRFHYVRQINNLFDSANRCHEN